jgi:hypothetical protein
MGDAMEWTVVLVAVLGAALWAMRRLRAKLTAKPADQACSKGSCEGCGVLAGCSTKRGEKPTDQPRRNLSRQ